MIGIVVFGHGKLPHEFVRAAELILGDQLALCPVGVEPDQGEATIINHVKEAMKKSDQGQGVLVLTDMFGGTPMNIGCRYLENTRVEVVTGANLAALIKGLTGRHQEITLIELANEVAAYGRRDISVAGELLRGTMRVDEAEA